MNLQINQKVLDKMAVRLRELRKEAELSQIALARILNVDTTVISRMENGEKPHFKPIYIIELAKLYQCSGDYLLCMTDERNPEKAQE